MFHIFCQNIVSYVSRETLSCFFPIFIPENVSRETTRYSSEKSAGQINI